MSRNATGQVVEVQGKHGIVYALRFRAYGRREYLTLGPVGADKAQRELRHVLADVERGTWKPSRPVAPPREVPTFHVFASEWFERQKLEGGSRGRGLSPRGAAILRWHVTEHLLPFFAEMPLDAITIEDVDRYRLSKVRARSIIDAAIAEKKPLMEDYTDPRSGRTWKRRQRAIGVTSINKSLQVLTAILESAWDYKHVQRNVAHGRRRRLPAVTPARTYLDNVDHIKALLDAAEALDNEARAFLHGRPFRPQRRAILATLMFGGPRIDEELSLFGREIDLDRNTIKIRESKSPAGVRTVEILPILHAELTAYFAQVDDGPDALVFGTSTGRQHSQSNIGERMLGKAVTRANEVLAKGGGELIPHLTHHSLRRTFASILFAVGEPTTHVKSQMGHKTAALTLEVYAREMARRDGEPERLKALVKGADWAEVGRNAAVVNLGDRRNQAA